MLSRALMFLKPCPRQGINQQELLHLQVVAIFFETFLIVIRHLLSNKHSFRLSQSFYCQLREK